MKAYVLSFWCYDYNNHIPDLGEIYLSESAARKARITLMKEAKASGDKGCDWAYWWSVSHTVRMYPGFPKAEDKRVWYTYPKRECGILIEEVEINE